uniref:Large ribosomal subunit protein uL10 n=1 Tax=Peromyscus maniculatus bairdii TaxID=230844 RepID=A0A8C8T710_PERMB
MPREDRATWKSNYFLKIIQLLHDYPKCFIVGTDNVGSKKMQQIRMFLRGKSVVLMGKNAMMRKAIRGHLENNPEDLTEIRDTLLANKVPAADRAGAIAPCEVTVPAQNTGLGPEKTSFFQALGITTKISRGTIEILSDGVRNVASVCRLVPDCCLSATFCINGYKWDLALSVETEYTFPLAEKVKAFLANPSAFVAAAPVAAATTAAAAPTKVEAKEESKESEEDMGFGLFD